MKELQMMIKRNIKLFFKDKGMLFTSLITPLILLVLYATFLSNVYRDSFTSALPAGITVSEDIIDGLVGGQLFSSLLAVSCVTVSFCCNLLMVQDKVNGANNDFMISPIKKSKKDLRKAKKRHSQNVKNTQFGAYVSLKTVKNSCF